jgi:hypothetical protein
MSIFEDVTVSNAQIDEMATAIQRWLQEHNLDLDVSKGTEQYDISVRSQAIFLATINAWFTKIKNARNLDYIKSLTDETLKAQMVDDLFSSMFLYRKSGSYSFGNLVCKITNFENIVIPAGTMFFNSLEYPFVLDSSNDYVVSIVNMKKGRENGIDFWFFEIPVKSRGMEPEYTLIAEEPLSTTWDYDAILSIAAKYNIEPALEEETTEAFIERAENTPSIAIPVTDRAAQYTFTAMSNVLKVIAVGANDLEMQRSKVTVAEGTIDVKNMADFYIKGKPVFNREATAKIEQIEHLGEIVNAIVLPDEYYIRIKEIKLTTGYVFPGYTSLYVHDLYIASEQVISMTNQNKREMRLSRESGLYYPLSFDELNNSGLGAYPDSNTEITVVYDTMDGLHQVQDYLNSPVDKVLCFNPIVKLMLPIFVSFNLKVRLDPTSTFVEADIVNGLRGFINNRSKVDLNINELYDFLKNNFDVIYMQTPVNLTTTYYNERWNIIEKTKIDEISLDDITTDIQAFSHSKYTNRLFTVIADETISVEII